ncbi:MAG: serine/threonine protein kinase, partial [Melioribacteraceae bacterium]|nr:serine/threonine protein kinase [Melioribacteraceae bacterium]
IIFQICDGLHFIHSKEIIHRDLKSQNIMFDGDKNLRIMDFGLSKSPLVSTMTSLGTVVGTLGYVAPEQVTGIEVDSRTDIFSLGVIMYQMITKELPFNGENEIALIHSIFNTQPKSPSEVNGNSTKELDAIILKTLAKEPGDRYNNVIELKSELNRIN